MRALTSACPKSLSGRLCSVVDGVTKISPTDNFFDYVTPSAVLLVAFNRAEQLKVLISHVRRVKPPTVYVVIDGPRSANEAAAVAATRDAVAAIDWTTDVRTRFRPKNIGCQKSVMDAVSWFLGEQRHGIVLEEDVVPTTSFFRFCDEMLARYENEPSAQAVCGVNLVPPSFVPSDCDYRLSIMGFNRP